jgi:hypothetical protein
VLGPVVAGGVVVDFGVVVEGGVVILGFGKSFDSPALHLATSKLPFTDFGVVSFLVDFFLVVPEDFLEDVDGVVITRPAFVIGLPPNGLLDAGTVLVFGVGFFLLGSAPVGLLGLLVATMPPHFQWS